MTKTGTRAHDGLAVVRVLLLGSYSPRYLRAI